MRREALAEEDDHGGAASVKAEGDTEMVDAAQYGESISGFRRASSVSAAAHSSASAPPSSTSSSSTLKRASLANIVHDMDVTPSATTHEVIEVASDSEDDSEDEEEGEPHEGGEPEEAEPEAEQEEDEEEDESSEDSEEEDSEDETDVPTATQAPIPPTPPPKISISDLTTTDVAPVAAAATEAPAQASTSTTEAAALGVEAAGSAAPAKKKPVSKRKRTPSPSPPPIAPPPPFTTIRLEIKLGGFERYTVDIHQLAKDTGQRPASPPPLHVADPVVVEEEPEEAGGKKKKRKKKSAAQEYYDTNDPFIDDSELAIDQRTHVAQTKQEGFYVSAGEVALLKDLSSPKKPKSTKKGLSATLHSTVNQAVSAAALKRDKSNTNGAERDGSPSDDPAQRALGMSNGLKGVGITNGQNQPGDPQGKGPSTGGGWTSNVADDEGEEKTGQKRKRYITVIEGGKKRKIVNINSFHPELQAAIEDLKKEIAKENWEQKGKFPPALKPHLSSLALLAIKLDEYDDHFFNLMPTLFPYNKFTMTKLIKRTVYPEHVALLQQRQDELLHELEDLSKDGFAKAEEEWQRSVTLWDKRQEKARAENAGASTDANGSISAAPSRHPSTEDKDGMDVDQPTASISAPPGTQAANNPNAHPPAKKFRLTEQMKAIIWDLVLLSNECCRLENEKNGYEQSVIQVSEQGLRKVLYQKIVAAFPDGWMSSGQISRDVSAMKKRLEKEALEND